ncbi:MAG: glutamate mutase L [Candidatus Promineifilaceae bacterium]
MAAEFELAAAVAPSSGEEKTTLVGESFLTADIGAATTSLALFDLVDGAYRLIARSAAPTSAGPPYLNAALGLQQAVAQLTDLTGRQFLAPSGVLMRPARADGSGVDHFVCSLSAAPPLRVALVGLLQDVSLASARRALESLYAQEVERLSLADARSQTEQVAALLHARPEVIVVAGGTEGGAAAQLRHQLETIALALSLMPDDTRPILVYSGNSRLHNAFVATFDGLADWRLAPNVRPDYERENLDGLIGQLADIYLRQQAAAVPGLERALDWSSFPMALSAHAFAASCEYFAARAGGRVLGLDVGADSLTCLAAEPGRVQLNVRADLGLGRPLASLAQDGGPAAIANWTSAEWPAGRIADLLLNKALRPHTLALSDDESLVEAAVVRILIQQAVREAAASWGWSPLRLPPFQQLILRGNGLVGMAKPAQTLLTALDGLQPGGVFEVLRDQAGILPALGLLAQHVPELTVQCLEHDGPDTLAWVVATVGPAGASGKSLELRLAWPGQDVLQAEVRAGSLELISLPAGESVELTIQPEPRVDIGYGPGRGAKRTIRGGALGLVVDTRGRPLELPADAKMRRMQLHQWLAALGA